MNLEQIKALAESKCPYLNDKDGLKIYIGSSANSPTAAAVFEIFKTGIEKLGIKARAILTGSSGYFDLEPTVLIEKTGEPALLYNNITPELAADLVASYLKNGNPGSDPAFCSTGNKKIGDISDMSDLPLFSLQKRVALRNCGLIDPEDINHYILSGQGYRGLARALQMDQLDVISELDKAGLPAHGSSGGSLADNWKTFHDNKETGKLVLCSALEIDPQSVTSKLLLESDPHSVLEGMLIAAYAIGASSCQIIINAEHTFAIQRLQKALAGMREYGLPGKNILGSSFSCEIEIREVTAPQLSEIATTLIRALDGKQLMPYLLKNSPLGGEFISQSTLVQDVETLSRVSAIFQNGPAWYRGFGTEQSPGTMVLTLSGDLRHSYLVEVPFGATLKNLIMDIGGGTRSNTDIQAVQFGGPAGIFLAADSLDARLDFQALKNTGYPVGSCRIEVFGGDFCAVRAAGDAVSYLHTQSCGKCVFCREGTLQMSDILDGISEGSGNNQDLDLLVELGKAMQTGSLCAFGQTAPNPVLSSVRLFRQDYEAHIKEKCCQLKSN